VPGAQVVFAGAMCSFGATPLCWQGDPGRWADELDRLVDLAPIVVPGHGPIGGEEEVRDLQRYLRACVAAGVLGFGMYHGGDIESCMRFLDEALALVRAGATYPAAAQQVIESFLAEKRKLPGFGHRIHTSDPRASRLLQMAHELELDGEHARMVRTMERVLGGRTDASGRPLPLNVDGAIAAVCGDMGFEPEVGNAMFIIARIPGLIAHACEERSRQAPMRQIDPKDAQYDGPEARRLPETRK